MRAHSPRHLGLGAALAFALTPLLFAGAEPASKTFKTEYYQGKVVPLANVLEKFGARLDAEAAPHWLALVDAAGKVYSLIEDEGARMFFKDAQLLNRPMRLTGRLYPDTQLLQVVEVHSYRDGKLHEVYYWCDVCSIRRSEKKICECCGGPMELREVPVQK